MSVAARAEPASAGPSWRAFSLEAFRSATAQAGELAAADWRLVNELARQQSLTPLRAVLELGYMGEQAVAERAAGAMCAPRWRPEAERGVISDAAPSAFQRASAILILEDEGVTRVVLSDPSDDRAVSAVMVRLWDRDRVELAIATHREIAAFFEEHAQDLIEDAQEDAEDAPIDLSAEVAHLRDMASEAPVVRFFNQAVERAMELGASDIHLERFDREVHLRYRVDGMLSEQSPPAPETYEGLLCRIKILAGLDIAERRRAQDGRIRMRLRGRNVDLRVSVVPTMYGQDAAIRLQDREKLAEVTLGQLGFTEPQVERLYETAAKAHGILLITGPTGSGKTTTLYAILKQLASTERKVMTVEDPVEYAMPGVNQIQVNPAIDLTFSNTLRHILRHDPDVVLVGEIRDAETAQMAIQAALTGHMVLSTLHTNDVPSSFLRLVDMGVEPYLVNAAVEGVSAQRLMRKRSAEGGGYSGRVAVMEFAQVTPLVKAALMGPGGEPAVREALMREGFAPMIHAAFDLIRRGVTDREEVVRVLGAQAVAAFEAEAGAGTASGVGSGGSR